MSSGSFNHISLTPILTSITENFEKIKDNMAVIRSDIRILKNRGDNESQGIYINEVNGQNSLQLAGVDSLKWIYHVLNSP